MLETKTVGREEMKNIMIMGEAFSVLSRQRMKARLQEEEIPLTDYENDVDSEKIGVSKYVKDKLDDLDLDTSDYSLEITTDKNDELSAIDIVLYGNEAFISKVFDNLKDVFKDVIVNSNSNESASRTTSFHCFTIKK